MGLLVLLALQFFYILRIDWIKMAKEASEFASNDNKSKDVELKNVYSLENPNYDYSNNKKYNLESSNKIDENKPRQSKTLPLEEISNEIGTSIKSRKKELIVKFIICLSIFFILCLSVYIHESNFLKIDLNDSKNSTINSSQLVFS